MRYPFDAAVLHPELAAALTPYAPYASTTAVARIIEARGLADGNSLLCWAHLLWCDAQSTDFDDDIVQLGCEAAAVLARIGADDPVAATAARLGKQIASRLARARRGLAKVEKLDKKPEEKLRPDQAEDLAFLLAERERRDPAAAAKAHRLWMRRYREVPDVTQHPSEAKPGAVIELHGHNYFYLEKAASALWWSGRREDARALVAQILDWPVARDVALYDAVGSMLTLLLLEAVEKRDGAQLDRLVADLRARHEALGKLPTLAHADVDAILAFAAEAGDVASLDYIVTVLMRDRSARSLGESGRENLAAAKRRLAKRGD